MDLNNTRKKLISIYPNLVKCAVVGIPDPIQGEVSNAFVVHHVLSKNNYLIPLVIINSI